MLHMGIEINCFLNLERTNAVHMADSFLSLTTDCYCNKFCVTKNVPHIFITFLKLSFASYMHPPKHTHIVDSGLLGDINISQQSTRTLNQYKADKFTTDLVTHSR